MKANTWLVPVLVLGFWAVTARAVIVMPNTCGMNLAASTLNEPLLRAFESSELNRHTLAVAERLLTSRFEHVLSRAPLDQNMLARLKNIKSSAFRFFNMAVNFYMHGMSVEGEKQVENFVQALRPVLRQAWPIEHAIRHIRETANDPDIYPSFSMAPQILKGGRTLERTFMAISENFYGMPISPRAMEAVRSVHQFSQTSPGDRILEIGFGSPTAMIALNQLIGLKIVGIDPDPTWQKLKSKLEPHINMIQGRFPDEAMAKVRAKAPYRAIYALDYYGHWGSAADLPVIYDLLDEGGVFLVINDFKNPPRFTQAEAERAGFSTFTFGAPRPITKEWLQVMPYGPMDVNAGQLALFVFRKGTPSLDRVSMKPKSK